MTYTYNYSIFTTDMFTRESMEKFQRIINIVNSQISKIYIIYRYIDYKSQKYSIFTTVWTVVNTK
jgi:hypothetical protein